jgi:hypothetical protein
MLYPISAVLLLVPMHLLDGRYALYPLAHAALLAIMRL